MARIDIDRNAFDAGRAALAASAARVREADAAVASAQRALNAARRAGASAAEGLGARLAAAQAARAAAAVQRRAADRRFDALAERAVAGRDPAALVGSLDGGQPIALLPVRLETRYVTLADTPTRLRIRLYPDDLHTVDHEAVPTAGELDAAQACWRARFAHDDAEAARLLRDLCARHGRGRATWVLRVTTPVNPLPAPPAQDEPQFPAVETIAAVARSTRAVLLPERFCAVGYGPGRREVFRVWGRTVPDELLLSPDWLATDDPQALLGGERAWMVDFDAALAVGMAIEVLPGQVARGFDLARGTLERLVVVGFDWTRSAADGAAAFADLLAAHRDSTGLGFVAPGTPTNNTEAAPAGHSPAEQRLPPAPAPGTASSGADALQLLCWAFGLDAAEWPPERIDHAHLSHQRSALHLMNLLWRGTFGDYLEQMWNPLVDGKEALGPSALYALRRYAAAYLRPLGALPTLRVGKQPYGLLPLVGQRFADDGGSAAETAVGKVLQVLRPLWERAAAGVPRLVDGDVAKAQDILQTAAWSQAAFYRDKDVKAMCMQPSPFSDAQQSGRMPLIEALVSALGAFHHWDVHIGACNDFLPDPPYAPGYLAGVPWVRADDRDATREAADDTFFGDADNYLEALARAARQTPAAGKAVLEAAQSGPALLQALAAYSLQKEQGDAVERFVGLGHAAVQVLSRATPLMPYVEAVLDNEATFTVQTPKELASVSIPAISGRATLGEHVAATLAAQSAQSAQSAVAAKAPAWQAAGELVRASERLSPPVRDLGGVALSLEFLATRSVGELNAAFRTTLDAFSYRLDAWIGARAQRRLEQLRQAQPAGLAIGAFAWVENLGADARPPSEGYLLAPSQAQAATAAILRSAFMSHHEHGAFDIALDSKRTRRALDILQGLTRDQPLAALYGYRIERALRDAQLGKFIWPLRLAYPWRAGSAPASNEPVDAIGARDVVDGVALLADAEAGPAALWTKLAGVLGGLQPPPKAPTADERGAVEAIVADALDLADSVSDLLLAEGTHQIVQGNPARAAAAMAVADKQSLPIETQVDRTPRGGASYSQRIAVLCPDAPPAGWPEDRRARAEPALNAWVAAMLGDPARYRFAARVHRSDAAGQASIDAAPVVAGLGELGLSPLSAVLLADGAASPRLAGRAETGLRGAVAQALIARLDDAAAVSALDIDSGSADAGHPGALGLADFEAIASTLKALIDRSRFATRKDLVGSDDAIESTQPPMGAYPGVDVAELVARADAAVAEFDAVAAALLAGAGADALRAALDAGTDLLPAVAWPAAVFAIDAPGADPAQREARAAEALVALQPVLAAIGAAVHADVPLLDGQAVPDEAQRAQHAVERLRRLFGKDFPVLPRIALGPYAAEFNASLAEQDALRAGDDWCVNGWLTQAARVREGADRFAAVLSAHEALCAPLAAGDLKLVQFPHRAGRAWAALPQAWVEPEGTPFDPAQVPEELREHLAGRPGAPYREIQRVAPDLAVALHAPALQALADGQTFAAFVCDDWPEFVPDPFQTAAIGFHFDAPGARPPQTVLLALPPRLGQAAWSFDDALDVVHEAFDLARLRAVRPRDLGSGLGAILPGNFLPHGYTDDLPSVRMLGLLRQARTQVPSSLGGDKAALVLGKV